MKRDMVTSMKNLATRRAAIRSMVITNLANIMTTTAKRVHTKRDLIITMIMVIRKKVDTRNITGTRKNMARKVDLTTTRSGDTRKAIRVIKSLNMNLIM